MSPFGLKFSQMILHTETSKLMYNWSFLFVYSFAQANSPTLLPSTFNIWNATHRVAYKYIKLIFEPRPWSRGLVRPGHGLARYCSTSGIGPPQKGYKIEPKKLRKNHHLFTTLIRLRLPLSTFFYFSTFSLYYVFAQSSDDIGVYGVSRMWQCA